MFSIHRKEEDGLEKVILKDNNTSTYATILPASGAILNDFVSFSEGQSCNVIDSYTSADDFKNNVEKKGFLGCKLSPFVCRLNKGTYHFGGREYTIEKYYSGKNALHGILYDKAFNLISESADEAGAFVSMKYEYRAEDPGYPFNYDCIITWKLAADNQLSVITECINKDQGLIPLQDGWHPYFDLGDSVDNLQLEIQSREMVEFDGELIPTKKLVHYPHFNSLKRIGDTTFDNCFTLNMNSCQPLCVLRNPARKIQVEIYPDTSYPYLQIYIPPHRKNIAIENISGAPDAFNNGMGFITLEAGASVSFKTAYRIHHLK